MKNEIDNKENVLELYKRSEKEKRRLSEKNAKLTITGLRNNFMYLSLTQF